mmetsp:Transcript_14664/g.29735  ORF Transcript_14664/g.29735 Transcript_14664/m.29735 type:complete len:211 (-) Transcript_14664:581-1213(-)
MKNIRAGGRHSDFENRSVFPSFRKNTSRSQLNFVAKLSHRFWVDINTNQTVDKFDRRGFFSSVHLRSYIGFHDFVCIIHITNSDGFHGEWCSCILREHGNDGIEHNVGLREIGGSAFNEHAFGVKGDARFGSVDDRRKGENCFLGVQHNWIQRGILDDRNIWLKMLARCICFIVFHQRCTIEFPFFISMGQGNKLDILGCTSIIHKRTFH